MPRPATVAFAVTLAAVATTSGQDAIPLAERFDAGRAYSVELTVDLSGRMLVPLAKDKPPQRVTMTGASVLRYDERVLPADDADGQKVLRGYRAVEFRRLVGDREQTAGVRPGVRRMVVLRAAKGGAKAPFSPDGPLTVGEIDVVRTDVFCPALVPGLLPTKAVRPGDEWPLAAAAVAELTDLETVDDGRLTAKFVGVATVDGRRMARLAVTGAVRGVDEFGPGRHEIDGSAYFDLDAGLLTYLSLKATHDLLDPSGRTTGRIDGRFVLTRKPAADLPAGLADAVVKSLGLKPGPENTQLLYDNPDLGVRLVHPRRWRVGAVQGRQLTLEESGGGGILVTMESAGRLPTGEQYRDESAGFIKKEKGRVLSGDKPTRAGPVERFALDVELNGERSRMEYAVVRRPDGSGLTFAARLPRADEDELRKDVERMLKSIEVTKAIK